MKIFKSDEQRNVIVFIVIIITICLTVYIAQNILINRCYRIVIGTIIKKSSVFDSYETKLTLNFHYNNEIITTTSMDNENGRIGERCFLKIACAYPKHSEAYWNIKIPDTLQYIPVNGWDKIPYGLDNSK